MDWLIIIALLNEILPKANILTVLISFTIGYIIGKRFDL